MKINGKQIGPYTSLVRAVGPYLTCLKTKSQGSPAKVEYDNYHDQNDGDDSC